MGRREALPPHPGGAPAGLPRPLPDALGGVAGTVWIAACGNASRGVGPHRSVARRRRMDRRPPRSVDPSPGERSCEHAARIQRALQPCEVRDAEPGLPRGGRAPATRMARGRGAGRRTGAGVPRLGGRVPRPLDGGGGVGWRLCGRWVSRQPALLRQRHPSRWRSPPLRAVERAGRPGALLSGPRSRGRFQQPRRLARVHGRPPRSRPRLPRRGDGHSQGRGGVSPGVRGRPSGDPVVLPGLRRVPRRGPRWRDVRRDAARIPASPILRTIPGRGRGGAAPPERQLLEPGPTSAHDGIPDGVVGLRFGGGGHARARPGYRDLLHRATLELLSAALAQPFIRGGRRHPDRRRARAGCHRARRPSLAGHRGRDLLPRGGLPATGARVPLHDPAAGTTTGDRRGVHRLPGGRSLGCLVGAALPPAGHAPRRRRGARPVGDPPQERLHQRRRARRWRATHPGRRGPRGRAGHGAVADARRLRSSGPAAYRGDRRDRARQLAPTQEGRGAGLRIPRERGLAPRVLPVAPGAAPPHSRLRLSTPGPEPRAVLPGQKPTGTLAARVSAGAPPPPSHSSRVRVEAGRSPGAHVSVGRGVARRTPRPRPRARRRHEAAGPVATRPARAGRSLMRFAYALMRDWPPLAWLARCSPTRPVVDVFHGPGVERTAEWFCDAVWAGAYETGGFDHTDVVFGSGGRLRNSTATFVSSGTTVDRLQSLETTDATWVSNSLPCLLAAVGGEPDPAYGAYFRDFGSIKPGLRR